MAISMQAPAMKLPKTVVCIPVATSLVICIATPLATGHKQKPKRAMQNMRRPLDIVAIWGGTYEMTIPTMEVVVQAPQKIINHKQLINNHIRSFSQKSRSRMGTLEIAAPAANHLQIDNVIAVLL